MNESFWPFIVSFNKCFVSIILILRFFYFNCQEIGGKDVFATVTFSSWFLSHIVFWIITLWSFSFDFIVVDSRPDCFCWLYQHSLIPILVSECDLKLSVVSTLIRHIYLLSLKDWGRSWQGLLGCNCLLTSINCFYLSLILISQDFFCWLSICVFCIYWIIIHLSWKFLRVLMIFFCNMYKNPLQACGRSWRGYHFFYLTCHPKLIDRLKINHIKV